MTEDGKLDLGDLKAMSCPTISNTMAAEGLTRLAVTLAPLVPISSDRKSTRLNSSHL